MRAAGWCVAVVMWAAVVGAPAAAATERVLYGFQWGNDGSNPNGNLIRDAAGDLIGTTYFGGGSPACGGSQPYFNGCGTVFELSSTPSGYAEAVIYRFAGGNDGAAPLAGLIGGADGVLFGTAVYGGGSGCYGYGCGTVYALTPTASGYTERVIYAFNGGSDGAEPSARLMTDAKGDLYGTTSYGGDGSCGGPVPGCGTVFKLKPTPSGYTKSVVFDFPGGYNGYFPAAGVIADAAGALYGVTASGGVTPCPELP